MRGSGRGRFAYAHSAARCDARRHTDESLLTACTTTSVWFQTDRWSRKPAHTAHSTSYVSWVSCLVLGVLYVSWRGWGAIRLHAKRPIKSRRSGMMPCCRNAIDPPHQAEAASMYCAIHAAALQNAPLTRGHSPVMPKPHADTAVEDVRGSMPRRLDAWASPKRVRRQRIASDMESRKGKRGRRRRRRLP